MTIPSKLSLTSKSRGSELEGIRCISRGSEHACRRRLHSSTRSGSRRGSSSTPSSSLWHGLVRALVARVSLRDMARVSLSLWHALLVLLVLSSLLSTSEA